MLALRGYALRAWTFIAAFSLAVANAAVPPTAECLNGTYSGVYSDGLGQDFFLGIPYLQAPVGDRRFHPADSLVATWNGTVSATNYASSCIGYGDQGEIIDPDTMAEDCLYLNIIRPHMNATTLPSNTSNTADSTTSLLPVLVFVHGGGFSGGSASESRYNLSFPVAQSVRIGQPVIAVSFNYRLSAWGFLYSNEIRDTGATNTGLRDQRFALAWIQENIAGQDAGASSVGFHLTAYAGRNDSLLRAAILQSGNPTPTQGMNGTQYYQPLYDQLTKLVQPEPAFATEYGMADNDTCWVSPDRMACLRNASSASMNAAINQTNPRGWFPVIDGDIVTEQPSRSLYVNKFVDVPIIIGANTDEGSYYMPSTKITTDAEFADLVAIVKAELYQGDAAINANRRQACQSFAKSGNPTYCYRFDVGGLNGHAVAAHGDELPFTFYNTGALPGHSIALHSIAKDISNSWLSFVGTLDPNAWRAFGNSGSSAVVTHTWPAYNASDPYEIVFQSHGSFIELDDWRATQTTLIQGPPSLIAVAYQR
ncbi:hypothetical protein SCUCBS95973_002915 [Sporothrix curviconia]|uniref:Carboxylesterase type B domain-containing protein n=1 Tax=Sporothrix curviconia TaxID=1260050 RepID=A0ABP0BAY1_9PEZI